MTSQESTPNYAKPAFYVGAAILSVIGGILVFADQFAWWKGSHVSWGYNFAVWAEMTPWWAKFLIAIQGLAFLFVAAIAIYNLYPFVSLSEELKEKTDMIGFWTSIGIVALTILLIIVFFIYINNQEYWLDDWEFNAGFYAGIFGGGLSALFFWFARRIEKPAK